MKKSQATDKKNKLIILIGPSGVGKSTFIERVLKEEKNFHDIITYTTRAPREGEEEGDPYHFVSKDRFEELIQQDYFVEWANNHGNLYGTPWNQFLEAWAKGLIVIMDVDVKGARHFKKEFPHATTIFLKAPSIDALRQRVIKRGIAKDIEVRMKTAEAEIAAAGEFDHLIINDDFETAYRQFRKLIENLLKNQ
jgi:guanylate kinase